MGDQVAMMTGPGGMLSHQVRSAQTVTDRPGLIRWADVIDPPVIVGFGECRISLRPVETPSERYSIHATSRQQLVIRESVTVDPYADDVPAETHDPTEDCGTWVDGAPCRLHLGHRGECSRLPNQVECGWWGTGAVCNLPFNHPGPCPGPPTAEEGQPEHPAGVTSAWSAWQTRMPAPVGVSAQE